MAKTYDDRIWQELERLERTVAQAVEVDGRLTRAVLVTLIDLAQQMRIEHLDHVHQHRLGKYGHF